MTVSVLVEGILKDELVDDFVQICKGAYSVTRAYDGCQSITLNLNVDNRNNFVMTEVWDSKEHYEKYLAFRTEEGTMVLLRQCVWMFQQFVYLISQKHNCN